MHHLSIDLETYSSVPLAKAGAQKYIQSPDFEILLFAFSVDGAPVQIIDLARGAAPRGWSRPSPARNTSSTPTMPPLSGAVCPSTWAPCRRTNGAAPCSTASIVATRQAWTPPARPWGSPGQAKAQHRQGPHPLFLRPLQALQGQRPAEPQPAPARPRQMGAFQRILQAGCGHRDGD